MIVLYLVKGFVAIIQGLLGVLPSLPPIPAEIETGSDWVIDFITAPVGLAQLIYSPVLFGVIVTLWLALIFFDQIFHTVMWIVRKIPMINVK